MRVGVTHNKIIVRRLNLSMSSSSEEEGYAPEGCLSGSQEDNYQQYRRRVEKMDENSIEGKWTELENLQYIYFMDFHSKIFASKEKRKTVRIFKSLSQFLKSRTPRQCRSHFQKIMSKFKTVKKVKLFYQDQLGVLSYQKQFEAAAIKIKLMMPKGEDEEERPAVETTSTSVQTDPMTMKLCDLPHAELLKLISIVQEQQKMQMTYWMPPPQMNMLQQSTYPN